MYVTFLKISFYRKPHTIFWTVFTSHKYKRAKYCATLYWPDSAGTANVILTGEIFGIEVWSFQKRKQTTSAMEGERFNQFASVSDHDLETLPSASGNITSQGFTGTSGQTFWYIPLKAMKYLYNITVRTWFAESRNLSQWFVNSDKKNFLVHLYDRV